MRRSWPRAGAFLQSRKCTGRGGTGRRGRPDGAAHRAGAGFFPSQGKRGVCPRRTLVAKVYWPWALLSASTERRTLEPWWYSI
jgi:hypothetical protein